MRQPAVCLALLLVLLCGAEAKKPAPQSKKSNVCLRNLYEVQYRVQNNRYVDKFAPVILARVQRDILQELRQRKVVGLCAPVSVRLLKGCFHVSCSGVEPARRLGCGAVAVHCWCCCRRVLRGAPLLSLQAMGQQCTAACLPLASCWHIYTAAATVAVC